MDDDLTRQYQRWREADDAGRDEDADAACRATFAALGREPAVSSDFTARTLSAVATVMARDARRARRVRRATLAGGVAATVAGVYIGGAWVLSTSSALLVRLLDLLVGLTVRAATGIQAGADIWSVLASLGRAAAAFVSDPAVTIAMFAMQGIAMAGLIALQRLLRSDREFLK
jgi:hypothetical protein